MEALVELAVNRVVWTIHRVQASAYNTGRRGYLLFFRDLPESDKANNSFSERV